MENTELDMQRANAQLMVNKLLDAAKKKKEMVELLVETKKITTYSDITLFNLGNIELKVPERNVEYWNLVVTDRKTVTLKLKQCASQFLFEILLDDLNNSFDKLTPNEQDWYLNM